MLKRLLEGVIAVGLVVGLYFARAAYLEQASLKPTASARAADLSAASGSGSSAATPQRLSAPTEANFAPPELARMKLILARFATGDFVGALQLADDNTILDAASPEFHAWVLAQMPALLTSAGWSRLKVGDCDAATTYLRRSEALKRSLETSKGLAVCYYKQKNIGGGREEFAWYVERSPDDAEMQVLFADILESEGAYDEAVQHLEAASEAPADKIDQTAVKQRLASMRARAKENVYQQVETSRNFRLLYRAGEHEDLVTFALPTLEDALDEYIEGYGLKAPPTPIEVILYPEGNFKNIVVGGPEWAEGLFDGRMRIPIRTETLRSKDYRVLREVLRHELVHALFSLASDARQLPPWFDEGMAQRLSCANPGCGEFQFPATPGGFLTAQSFFTPYTSFDAVRAGRAYKQSLYLILALEKKYGADALRQIASSVSIASDISSDGLLKPLNLTFEQLQTETALLWNARATISDSGAR